MTVKKHTPSGAQSSTSVRTQTRPATPSRPKGKAAAVDHALVAWALAGVLWQTPESKDARRIMDAADALGAATGSSEQDYRPEFQLRALLNTHTSSEAYIHSDAQDRRRGRLAYRKLVALAGGAEGAPEPEDKDSCAWWCWTMRRIRAEFYTDPGEPGSAQEAASFRRYFAAWREVDSLAFGIFGGSEARTGIHYALGCLPALVKVKQWANYWAAKKGGKS